MGGGEGYCGPPIEFCSGNGVIGDTKAFCRAGISKMGVATPIKIQGEP